MAMKIAILSYGAHLPMNEGISSYVMGLIEALGTTDQPPDFCLLSTISPIKHPSKRGDLLTKEAADHLCKAEFFDLPFLVKQIHCIKSPTPRLMDVAGKAWVTLRALKTMLEFTRSGSGLIHAISWSDSIVGILERVVDAKLAISMLDWSNGSFFPPLKASYICTSHRILRGLAMRYGMRGYLIPPTVSETYYTYRPDKRSARRELGIDEADVVMSYVGSAASGRLPYEIVSLVKRLSSRLDILFLAYCPEFIDSMRNVALLRKHVKHEGLDSCVRILDRNLTAREKAKVFIASDLAVYPFTLDHAPVVQPPLSMLEALASGTPVVASRVASAEDVVNDTVGLLLDPLSAGTLSGWHSAVSSLLADSSLLKQLSANAASLADDFSPNTVGRKLLAVYQDTMRRF
jgi:glycosyltransferase involved in cell wall biosynthesis